MLKLWFALLSFQFAILATVTGNSIPANDSIYFKFRQSDYKIKVEWFEAVRFKSPEMTSFKVNIFKYNRTCPGINATFGFTIDVGNEMEVIAQVYKFSSNEYRLFPVRLQLNFCKALASNVLGVGTVVNCGNFTGCPLRKKTYHVCNWIVDQSQFPPRFPAGRFMVEYQGLYRDQELWVTRGYSAVSRDIVKK